MSGPSTARRWSLPLLFFVSGAASLVLETVWTRQMVLVFGSTTFAVSTVLTAFMAGLAGGSFIAGRRLAGRVSARKAILIYGVLELAIAVYALLLPLLIAQLPALHRALWGIGSTSYHGFALLRFLLAFALLALPTLAMGATLPVLTHALAAVSRDEPGQAPTEPTATGKLVGTLYAINTAGAVAGVLLAGFVLLPSIGMFATNLTACIADLALAAVAAFLWWRAREPAGATVGPANDTAEVADRTPDSPQTPAVTPLAARLALLSLVVSGALSMAYEVAWARSLSLVIGSSTYAFSLILLCFLLGLAGGAALYARRQTKSPDQIGNLATIHLLVAATALAGTAFIDRLPALLLVALKALELSPLTAFLLKFALAATVIALPALFMGMVFPAVVQIWSSSARREPSRTAGDVYSINTIGSIIGSFAAGFLLVPWLGLQRTLVLLVLFGCGLAGLFAAFSGGRLAGRAVRVGGASGLAIFALFGLGGWDLQMLSAGVFRVSRYEEVLATVGKTQSKNAGKSAHALRARVEAARRAIPLSLAVDTFAEPSEGYRLTRHREGVTTTVGVGRTVDQALSAEGCWVRHALLVNGKPDASLSVLHPRPSRGCRTLLAEAPPGPGLRFSPSGDAETQLLSGLLPALLARETARDALVIGWGSGVTVGAALAGGLKRIVAVELEREVIAAARVFEPYNGLPQRDRRVRIVTEDGRNYLAARDQRFDVIISEPSNPWMAGCGNLFTREFFEQVRAHLRPGGVFLQWLQAYEIAPRNVFSILGTLASVFPSVHVFSPVRASTDLLLVARPEPTRLDWQAIDRRFSRPGLKRALHALGIHAAADVLVRLRAGPRAVRAVSRSAPLNTDDNARIEFAAPRDLINYKRYSSRAILSALRKNLDLARVVDNAPARLQERLCMARLRAGRIADAKRAATPRCAAVAAVLSAHPTRSKPLAWLRAIRPRDAGERRARDRVLSVLGALKGSPQERARLLAARFSVGRDPWLDAALARLLLEANRRFEALALATAAAQQAKRPLRAALDGLRAVTLRRCRAHLAAFSIARNLVSRKLSTAKSVPAGVDSHSRPSTVPTSRASSPRH